MYLLCLKFYPFCNELSSTWILKNQIRRQPMSSLVSFIVNFLLLLTFNGNYDWPDSSINGMRRLHKSLVISPIGFICFFTIETGTKFLRMTKKFLRRIYFQNKSRLNLIWDMQLGQSFWWYLKNSMICPSTVNWDGNFGEWSQNFNILLSAIESDFEYSPANN